MQAAVLLVGEQLVVAEPDLGGSCLLGPCTWRIHSSACCVPDHGGIAGTARLHSALQGAHH